MLKLKQYQFSGIGRFTEKQTINIELRNHLIQVDGINETTGGSSGAGKSTTVEALAYLLGISETPATQLQSRISEEGIWVRGEFEGGIVITRSKKGGLIIETPEETVSGNNKLAEEKLDQIIGVHRDLLKTMCYKRQKQGGFFLNLTPKQSYEFLIQCLDLKEFQSKINILEDMLKNKYKPRKIELEATIEVIENNIYQLNTLLKEKTIPTPPNDSSNDLKNNLQKIQNKLDELENTYVQELETIGTEPVFPGLPVFEKEKDLKLIEDEILKIKAAMYERAAIRDTEIEQAFSAVNKIQNKIEELNRFKKLAIQIDSKTQDLSRQYQHLEEGNCPTCYQNWKDDKTQQKIKEIEKEIDDNKKLFKHYMDEVKKIPHYEVIEQKARELLEIKKKALQNSTEEKELIEYQEKQRILLNEKQNLNSIITQEYFNKQNAWKQKRLEILNKFDLKKSELNQNKILIQHKLDMIEMDRINYQKNLLNYQQDCENIQNKIAINTKDLKNQKKELEKIEKDTLLSEESIRLIKNFTLQKFQNTLDYIGQKATEIINMIPNMANAVIFFENSKETKTGSIKNEVNAVVNLEGDSHIPIKTLSGGERTSADFAIDLAVSEMIENMTQKGVNFMIIDEGFDGLDSISKIQCLEILKNINTEKKIFLIDHSSEVKEMIYDIITVKRIGEESFVQ